MQTSPVDVWQQVLYHRSMTETPEKTEIQPVHVLIVDNDKDLARAMTETLAASHPATNAAQARARDFLPHVAAAKYLALMADDA